MTIKVFTLGELLAMPDPLAGKVIVEDNYIVIRDEYEYEIPLDECTTKDQLWGWVMHLCEKGWISSEIIRRVIKTANEQNNLKIRY
ncbi:hypothetical protein ACFL5R_01565 [Pseudomonadota bacterium]